MSAANMFPFISWNPDSVTLVSIGGPLSLGPVAEIIVASGSLVNGTNPPPKSTSGVTLNPTAISVI